MPDSELDEKTARELLSKERERIEESLADLKRVRGSEAEEARQDANPEDAGGQIEEEEVDKALERKLQSDLDAIGRAEQRLADGTYGLSIDSGEPIPAERLKAIPWAERTVEEER